MEAVSTATAAAAASTLPVYKCALPGCEITNQVATLKLCSACQDKLPTRYCSPGHQRADWKRHKMECLNNRPDSQPTGNPYHAMLDKNDPFQNAIFNLVTGVATSRADLNHAATQSFDGKFGPGAMDAAIKQMHATPDAKNGEKNNDSSE